MYESVCPNGRPIVVEPSTQETNVDVDNGIAPSLERQESIPVPSYESVCNEGGIAMNTVGEVTDDSQPPPTYIDALQCATVNVTYVQPSQVKELVYIWNMYFYN